MDESAGFVFLLSNDFYFLNDIMIPFLAALPILFSDYNNGYNNEKRCLSQHHSNLHLISSLFN